MCNCKIRPCVCEESIFIDSWKCNDNTTTSTTSTSTTSTTTSSTTTTTTTLNPQLFTINNNSQYDDLEYFVFHVNNGTNLITRGIIQSGQSFSHSFNILNAGTVTIWVRQYYSQLIYVSTTLEVTGQPDDIKSYGNGVIDFQYNSVIPNASLYELTIIDEAPITTTTSTTSSTTSTSTTSSTTTSTTTLAPDPLIVRVTNNRTSPIGTNTETRWGTAPFTSYYGFVGTSVAANSNVTLYNGPFGLTNQTNIIYQNTGFQPVTVSVYYSNNNGVSYSLLGTHNLSAATVPPYPQFNQTYNTVPNNTGVTNIIDLRVTNGAYSTSNYTIRVINNAGYQIDLNQIINRSSPSNLVYSTTNNLTLNSGANQQLYTGNLLEASTRVTIRNQGEQFLASFYYSNNNGTSFTLVGSTNVGFGALVDNSYLTASPGNGSNCILEIRLT